MGDRSGSTISSTPNPYPFLRPSTYLSKMASSLLDQSNRRLAYLRTTLLPALQPGTSLDPLQLDARAKEVRSDLGRLERAVVVRWFPAA